jgi:hypothetical protein
VKTTTRWGVVLVVASVLGGQGCASPTASSSSAPRAPTDPPSPSTEGSTAAAAVAVTPAPVEAAAWDVAEQLLRRYEQARSDKALACWRGLPCESPPPLPEVEGAARMLAIVPADRRYRDIAAGLARAELDAATGRYRDLPLLSAKTAQRLAEAGAAGVVLHADAAASDAVWEKALATATARATALGLPLADLLARRAAMTRQEVVALAEEVLSGPDLGGAVAPADLPRRWGAPAATLVAAKALDGPLVDVEPTVSQASNVAAPFAGCFLISPPETIVVTRGRLRTPAALLVERYARGAAVGARLTPSGQVPDLLFVKTTAYAAQLSAPRRSSESAEIAARLRLRWAAASTLALLDDNDRRDPAARDALAARVVGARAPQAGAGRLLGVHPSGRVVDELVARVAAAAMLHALSADLGEGWSARSGQRRRAADLLLLHFAEWRQNGLAGLLDRAGIEAVASLHPLGAAR